MAGSEWFGANPYRALGRRIPPGTSEFFHPFSTVEGARGAYRSFEGDAQDVPGVEHYGSRQVRAPDYAERPLGGHWDAAFVEPASGSPGARGARPIYGGNVSIEAGEFRYEGDAWAALGLSALGVIALWVRS